MKTRINAFLENVFESHIDVTSFQTVVVTSDGSEEYLLEDQDYGTDGTYYAVGSCTKPITALAVLHYLERNEGHITDKISSFNLSLPDTIESQNPSIEQLLSHSSGLTTTTQAIGRIEQHLGTSDMGYDFETKGELYSFIDEHTRIAEPRTFHYYNSGYVILQELINSNTNRTFESYVQKYIFDPYDIDGVFAGADNIVTPYSKEEGKGFKQRSNPSNPLFNSEGGLFLSADGAISYIQMFLDDASEILSGQSYKEMCEPRVPSILGATVDGNNYCLGLNQKQFLTDTVYTHCGISVSSAGFAYTGDTGVFCMMNGPCSFYPSNVPLGILALLQGRSERAVPYFNLNEIYSELTGIYTSSSELIQVTVSDNQPYLELSSDSDFISETLLLPYNTEKLQFITYNEGGKKQPIKTKFTHKEETIELEYNRFILDKVN